MSTDKTFDNDRFNAALVAAQEMLLENAGASFSFVAATQYDSDTKKALHNRTLEAVRADAENKLKGLPSKMLEDPAVQRLLASIQSATSIGALQNLDIEKTIQEAQQRVASDNDINDTQFRNEAVQEFLQEMRAYDERRDRVNKELRDAGYRDASYEARRAALIEQRDALDPESEEWQNRNKEILKLDERHFNHTKHKAHERHDHANEQKAADAQKDAQDLLDKQNQMQEDVHKRKEIAAKSNFRMTEDNELGTEKKETGAIANTTAKSNFRMSEDEEPVVAKNNITEADLGTFSSPQTKHKQPSTGQGKGQA